MSPFIVTTKRHEAERDHGDGPPPYEVISRYAVATLQEARAAARVEIIEGKGTHVHSHRAIHLPESGGTVGPLPDGTVIEVKQVSWLALARAGGCSEWAAGWAATTDPDGRYSTHIVEAFNTRQS